jgi:hypothetical protein
MIEEPLPDLNSEVMAKLIYDQLNKSDGLSPHNHRVTPEIILRIEGLVNKSVTTPGLVTVHKPRVFEKWLTSYLSDANVDAMETIYGLKRSKSKVARAIAKKVLKERYGIDHQFTIAVWALTLSGISILSNIVIAVVKYTHPG